MILVNSEPFAKIKEIKTPKTKSVVGIVFSLKCMVRLQLNLPQFQVQMLDIHTQNT